MCMTKEPVERDGVSLTDHRDQYDTSGTYLGEVPKVIRAAVPLGEAFLTHALQ